MKTFVGVQVFLLVLYIFGTEGRHAGHNDYEDLPEGEQTELSNQMNDHASQTRHHRRPRQMYGYNYQPPYPYDYRRDYGVRQQEEYLSRIVKSLDEIISYIRRPPPPPQPVYIPYPVFQDIPCRSQPRPIPAPAVNETTTQIPDVTIRFPDFEDENQLWGLPNEEIPEEEEGSDGSRPISFDPIKPNRPTRRPPLPVEHGSNQAGSETTTAAPIRRPGTCETAILTCCTIQGRTAQRNCFARYDCSKTYATNRACDPAVIKRVLDHFSNAYAPVKNK